MAIPVIPFNKPYLTGKELLYIEQAHQMLQLAGDGYFTKKCSEWLEKKTGSQKALITHSCTAALEMCALLLNIQAGDEIIMPSYTFVSTANAFALRGATIKFADIDPVTLNISPDEISRLISKRTKAVVIVHYAGVACEMSSISGLCRKNNIFLIEDAAQAILSYHKQSHLGTIGDFGCLSFHETKNIIAGEGGALLINNPDFVEMAEVVREKGTNRSRFFRGEVDKYSWVNIGSSFLPGEITTAFLWAQLEEAQNITRDRLKIWNHYDRLLSQTCASYGIQTPILPDSIQHNGHIYYLIFPTPQKRDMFIARMKEKSINCVFHYVPLHNSEFAKKMKMHSGTLRFTERVSECLVRLPLWNGMSDEDVKKVGASAIETILEIS